jgi:hypothetical protein
MSEGEIRSAKVSRDEPVWSVNFKKALALQLQTKLDLSNREQEENRVRYLEILVVDNFSKELHPTLVTGP